MDALFTVDTAYIHDNLVALIRLVGVYIMATQWNLPRNVSTAVWLCLVSGCLHVAMTRCADHTIRLTSAAAKLFTDAPVHTLTNLVTCSWSARPYARLAAQLQVTEGHARVCCEDRARLVLSLQSSDACTVWADTYLRYAAPESVPFTLALAVAAVASNSVSNVRNLMRVMKPTTPWLVDMCGGPFKCYVTANTIDVAMSCGAYGLAHELVNAGVSLPHGRSVPLFTASLAGSPDADRGGHSVGAVLQYLRFLEHLCGGDRQRAARALMRPVPYCVAKEGATTVYDGTWNGLDYLVYTFAEHRALWSWISTCIAAKALPDRVLTTSVHPFCDGTAVDWSLVWTGRADVCTALERFGVKRVVSSCPEAAEALALAAVMAACGHTVCGLSVRGELAVNRDLRCWMTLLKVPRVRGHFNGTDLCVLVHRVAPGLAARTDHEGRTYTQHAQAANATPDAPYMYPVVCIVDNGLHVDCNYQVY